MRSLPNGGGDFRPQVGDRPIGANSAGGRAVKGAKRRRGPLTARLEAEDWRRGRVTTRAKALESLALTLDVVYLDIKRLWSHPVE